MPKVYTCKTFSGFWPVGTAAVVIAESEDDARELLHEALIKRTVDGRRLPGITEGDEFVEMGEGVRVLCDGNY